MNMTYPHVAELLHKTPSCAERSARHAINYAGMRKKLKKGVDKTKKI